MTAHRRWTPGEDAIVDDYELTAAQVAERIDRTEAAVWVRRRKLQLQHNKPSDSALPHGKLRYQMLGCRCDPCKTANQQAHNIATARKQRRSQKSAHASGRVWTRDELALCLRRDLSAMQVAALTGRTFEAVKSRRHILRSRGITRLSDLGGMVSG